jgi:hypothetical protein
VQDARRPRSWRSSLVGGRRPDEGARWRGVGCRSSATAARLARLSGTTSAGLRGRSWCVRWVAPQASARENRTWMLVRPMPLRPIFAGDRAARPMLLERLAGVSPGVSDGGRRRSRSRAPRHPDARGRRPRPARAPRRHLRLRRAPPRRIPSSPLRWRGEAATGAADRASASPSAGPRSTGATLALGPRARGRSRRLRRGARRGRLPGAEPRRASRRACRREGACSAR